MGTCCDDPTEPHKIDPRELVREQQRHGDLLQDLFTGDPEKVMLKQLHEANNYLRELAALRAHYPAVRLHAIELLDKNSTVVLRQIIEKEANSEFAEAARKQLERIENNTGILGKLFHK